MHVDFTTMVAFLGILSTFVLGYLGYKRSQKADTTTQSNSAIEQVVTGLNALVDNLQDDNKILRSQVKDLRDALQNVTEERDKLKQEVQLLHSQYGAAS